MHKKPKKQRTKQDPGCLTYATENEHFPKNATLGDLALHCIKKGYISHKKLKLLFTTADFDPILTPIGNAKWFEKHKELPGKQKI